VRFWLRCALARCTATRNLYCMCNALLPLTPLPDFNDAAPARRGFRLKQTSCDGNRTGAHLLPGATDFPYLLYDTHYHTTTHLPPHPATNHHTHHTHHHLHGCHTFTLLSLFTLPAPHHHTYTAARRFHHWPFYCHYWVAWAGRLPRLRPRLPGKRRARRALPPRHLKERDTGLPRGRSNFAAPSRAPHLQPALSSTEHLVGTYRATRPFRCMVTTAFSLPCRFWPFAPATCCLGARFDLPATATIPRPTRSIYHADHGLVRLRLPTARRRFSGNELRWRTYARGACGQNARRGVGGRTDFRSRRLRRHFARTFMRRRGAEEGDRALPYSANALPHRTFDCGVNA